jgi:WhiB family transcriptional regulator, redox-sensing transcriptional regulator
MTAPAARSWRDAAVCTSTDPELFYPGHGRLDETRAAKRICQSCTVRVQCLEFALASGDEHGIWGGMSPGERARSGKALAA